MFDTVVKAIKNGGAIGFLFTIILYIVLGMAFGIDLGTIGLIITFAVMFFAGVMMSLYEDRCPVCKKMLSMEEVNRCFERSGVVKKSVTVPDTRTYRIDGKVHVVHETKREERFVDVDIYKCIERCKYCGHERYVTKNKER